MKNLEVKAKCASLELTIQSLVELGAKHEKKMYQIDTYFNVPEGRLKLREEGLDFANLIYYHRFDTAESCYSNYHICQINDLDSCKLILSSALGTKIIVEKARDLWWFGNTRVHLDHVSGLGNFIEL